MPRTILPLGIALLFLLLTACLANVALPAGPMQWLVILGAVAAGYMALNIGANDVANNVGPAVGAKALTMASALALAAVFDAAGALLAGSDVVDTVANNIIAYNAGLTPLTLIQVMIAALVAAALWINASTFVGAPVSTTHAIIGGIVGAAVAAAGFGAVNWPTVGVIAVSWMLSPLLGAIFAAALHGTIRRTITRRANKIAAARIWVPVLVAAMSGIFAIYLATKAPPHWWQPNLPSIIAIGIAAASIGWLVAMPWVRIRSLGLTNRKKQVAKLFRPPLIVAAALLSFAHGANDVANALGPLVAIVRAAHLLPTSGTLVTSWELAIGAAGIALGIALFGPRVIHTVGEQITKLNEIRAFCVALSAAVTVLTASALGLPVSSTHVAVGAVFGVGFVREFLAIRNMNGAAVPVRASLVDATMLNDRPEDALARERRNERRYLVRRLKVAQIGVAWLVTLPAAAALAALLYRVLIAFTG
ncbi:inorganic phosphate transporter, PiT family [Devosia sp. YR412]|uniref:inorganic phosphate transporter n=1 Tax=Devosia sp. YR412 TaxID=1881030 RepID=UPI0008C50A02|nr:inorganic phosphate transporter [Devosia sp. YR412]SEQ00280.1 inorganic phosphate transporter, PiT family [Devosia sp. YR412]